ncbi:MAG: ferritin family protein, partial [Desulfosarcinaceae bacterium]
MEQSMYEDILNAAIQSEIEANRFYQQVAEKVTDSFLKEMFLSFAREEDKHRRILEGFRGKPGQAVHFASASDFHVSETVDEPVLSIEMKPAEAIALAMKKEEA